MKKYKIQVVKRKGFWNCSLYKKSFLWWRIVEQYNDEIPYSAKIIRWQEKYSIPDERVCFY
jgi:hypothetical protein